MSFLSIVHVVPGLLAVAVGATIFALRKGDPRHRLLGWIYVGLMSTSLVAILIRGAREPKPFHGYALLVAGGIVAAMLAPRLRSRFPTWRAWHAVLMSFSMLGAIVAMGGVIGGVVIGVGNGPAYYRMFNVVIAAITLAGLWVINTRPIIWGNRGVGRDRAVRLTFTAIVLAASAGLVLAQWALFQ